jgi:hypothetical protein
MIHTPTNVVLLTLVVLWHLVVVSGLLRLWSLPLSAVVKLAWSVLGISLGTTIGIVSHFTTSDACVTASGNRGIVPYRCSCRGVLVILRKVGTLHRLIGMLSLLLLALLVGALVLILPVVDTLSSTVKRCSLRWRETRARVVAELPRRLKLSLLLTHLLASMLHHDGSVHHILEILESVHHQLILDRTNHIIPKVILLLCIICYICGSVAIQLDELVLVLTHRH